jgi:hypothetical protein
VVNFVCCGLAVFRAEGGELEQGNAMSNPHPEERGTRVSKDEATGRASWFETPLARLLTMRG